jgi:magnesium-transporting ATPase (P-type)
MALSYGVGDYVEGGVLTAVIVLNCGIGFFQEYKAEKKMTSLRALSSPSAAVLRDGKIDVIPRYVAPVANQLIQHYNVISKMDVC